MHSRDVGAHKLLGVVSHSACFVLCFTYSLQHELSVCFDERHEHVCPLLDCLCCPCLACRRSEPPGCNNEQLYPGWRDGEPSCVCWAACGLIHLVPYLQVCVCVGGVSIAGLCSCLDNWLGAYQSCHTISAVLISLLRSCWQFVSPVELELKSD